VLCINGDLKSNGPSLQKVCLIEMSVAVNAFTIPAAAAYVCTRFCLSATYKASAVPVFSADLIDSKKNIKNSKLQSSLGSLSASVYVKPMSALAHKNRERRR